MKGTNKAIIWCIGALLGLWGCDADTECRQSSAVYLNVVFMGDSLRQSTDSLKLSFDSLAQDTIRFSTVTGMEIHGLGRDSILYEASDVITTVHLPLRPDSTHTDFVFRYNGATDTVSILHDNDMQFISLACGCFVFHTIEGLNGTRHFMDSAHILNDAVTTSADTHMRFFFHKW